MHPTRLLFAVAALCGLSGCSDYNLEKQRTVASGGAVDTAPPEDTSPPDDTAPPEDTSPPDPPPDCETWAPGALPDAAIDETCLVEAGWGLFEPAVEWQWSTNPVQSGYHQVMSTPMVAGLTDDNSDGAIDEHDVPDVIFTAFSGGAYQYPGVLTAISGDGSGTWWSVSSVDGYRPYGAGGVAVGDLEGDGSPDVCVASADAAVLCLEADGSFKFAAGTVLYAYGHPAIADLDGDGQAEVVIGGTVVDTDGTVLSEQSDCIGRGGTSVPVDIDGDGDLEIAAGCGVYEADGTLVWADGLPDGIPAVGDFDLDGEPELVRTSGGTLILTDTDGTVMWTQTIPGRGSGGAPTVADYDGDGLPEVGVASLSLYSMFDTDGSVRWSNPTNDASSSVTGSSVFDFDRDGAAEVVYADQFNLFVYDGASGLVRMDMPGHANGTLYEYPVIADVDGDGSTEIVLASNNYTYAGWTGITVIGDLTSTWAPARKIWNQFAYHITNVADDGSIPAVQADNWASWNNFRAGGTGLGPSDWLADLQAGPAEVCVEACSADVVRFSVAVRNHGRLSAPESVAVVQRSSDGTVLTQAALPSVDSGEAVWAGPFELTKDEWGPGTLALHADLPGTVEECDDTNNRVDLGGWPCD